MRRFAWPVVLLALPVLAALVGPPSSAVNTVVVGAAGGDQLVVALAATDAGALAVWEDSRRNARGVSDLYATPVSPTGTPAEPSGHPLVVGAYGVGAPSLACTTGVCLLAWRQGLNAWEARLSEDGTFLDPEPKAIVTGRDYVGPVVTSAADTFALAWGWDERLFVSWRTLDGRERDFGTNALEPGDVLRRFTLAADPDAGTLAAWYVDRADAGAALLAAPVDSAGLLAPPVLVWPAAVRDPHLVSDGVTWLLTWENPTGTSYGEIWGVRLAPDGTLIDPTPLVLSGTQVARSIAAAFDGTSYVVAWYSDNDPSADLQATWLSPDSGAFATAPLSADRSRREFPVLARTAGGLLATWTRADGYYVLFDLHVGMVDDGGLDPAQGLPLTRTGDAHLRPRLMPTGTGATLAITTNHVDTAGYELQLVPLGLDGAPRGGPFALADIDDRLDSAAVGFDGTQYVAGYRAWPEWRTRAYSTTGAPLTPEAQLRNDAYSSLPAVIASGPVPLLTWSSYVGGPLGTQAFAVRLQGGQPLDVPPLVLSPDNAWYPVAAPVAGGWLVAFDTAAGVTTAVLSLDGGVTPGAVLDAHPLGTPPRPVKLDGEGDTFLVAWNEISVGYPTLVGQLVNARGQPVGGPLALLSRTDLPWSYVYTTTDFAVAWTGDDFLVAFDADAIDGGSARDIRGRRVSRDGVLSAQTVLSASPESEEQPALVRLSRGRLLLSYLEYQPLPGADTMRARVRLLADVPDGYECLGALECQSGACVRGVCCSVADGGCDAPTLADGGVPPLADGGQPVPDGGATTSTGRYTVGCGCGADGLGGGLLALVALAFTTRQRSRR